MNAHEEYKKNLAKRFREDVDHEIEVLVEVYKNDTSVGALIRDAIREEVEKASFHEEDYRKLRNRFLTVKQNMHDENELADDDEAVDVFRQDAESIGDSIVSLYGSGGLENALMAHRIYIALHYLIGITGIEEPDWPDVMPNADDVIPEDISWELDCV